MGRITLALSLTVTLALWTYISLSIVGFEIIWACGVLKMEIKIEFDRHSNSWSVNMPSTEIATSHFMPNFDSVKSAANHVEMMMNLRSDISDVYKKSPEMWL